MEKGKLTQKNYYDRKASHPSTLEVEDVVLYYNTTGYKKVVEIVEIVEPVSICSYMAKRNGLL